MAQRKSSNFDLNDKNKQTWNQLIHKEPEYLSTNYHRVLTLKDNPKAFDIISSCKFINLYII